MEQKKIKTATFVATIMQEVVLPQRGDHLYFLCCPGMDASFLVIVFCVDEVASNEWWSL